MMGDSGFRALVVEDAKDITNREDTDSIPIIDDIHGELRRLEAELDTKSNSRNQIKEITEKRKLIGLLLSNMNLKIVNVDDEMGHNGNLRRRCSLL